MLEGEEGQMQCCQRRRQLPLAVVQMTWSVCAGILCNMSIVAVVSMYFPAEQSSFSLHSVGGGGI